MHPWGYKEQARWPSPGTTKAYAPYPRPNARCPPPTPHKRRSTPAFFAIVTDLVGTPTELVDEHGNLAWRARSTLWGTTAWTANSSAYTPLRFPGQYYDPETGLHYNFFRHYDPETARYLSPDPLGLSPAPNPVTYVSNPHTWTDPWGLAPGCLNKLGEKGKDSHGNVMSGSAEGQKLADRLRQEPAEALFDEHGWVTPQAIAEEAKEIINGVHIKNGAVCRMMTEDGSRLADWSRHVTRTHQSPSGEFHVHFYYNKVTGKILPFDYKIVFKAN